ncbi:hypothetical protein [Sphingobacterium alkalisoli]|nr:hypothetical protein [Sphingobacterium alkalisoli]
MEGDSSYVARVYGKYADTSLIRDYYGTQRNNGIVFLFTKEKVHYVTKKKLERCLKNRKCKILFKIDNDPLTDSYRKLNIDKIKMIKDFYLTHWDTGAVDTFTLFLINSKK